MKKLGLILVIMAMICALAACGGKTDTSSDEKKKTEDSSKDKEKDKDKSGGSAFGALFGEDEDEDEDEDLDGDVRNGEDDNDGEDEDVDSEQHRHVDKDKDDICDECYMYTDPSLCEYHQDDYGDGYCSMCGTKIPCKHEDVNDDGLCDRCGDTFHRMPLKTPTITYVEREQAMMFTPMFYGVSWYEEQLDKDAYKYVYSINGVEVETYDYEIDGVKDGDRIKVKATTGAKDPRFLDSEWSKEFVFHYNTSYDFTGLSLLNAAKERRLISYLQYPAGEYDEGSIIKCVNGDLICDDSWNGKYSIYSTDGGYYNYVVRYNDNRRYYEMTDYAKDKNHYYDNFNYAVTALCVYGVDSGTGKKYQNYKEFLTEKGITLLPYDELDVDDQDRYEMSYYKEYSETVNPAYLMNSFMHKPTREFVYLPEFAGKIESWEVQRIESPAVFQDSYVTVYFNEKFDHNDYGRLRDILFDYGVVRKNVDLFPELPEISETYNELNGLLPVFTNPFEHEGEQWYDTYTILGTHMDDFQYNYRMKVEYGYKYWYDGGSFATYVVRQDGLWRFRSTNNSTESWLMIDTDGNHRDYSPWIDAD